MTFGADADYYSPSERLKKNFLDLPDDALALIELVRVNVADADSIETIEGAVDALNSDLLDRGLLGRTSQLTSEFSVVSSRELKFKDSHIHPVYSPEEISNGVFEGVFAGCGVMPLNGVSPELVYIVELPLDIKGLKLRTVAAAVDSSRLSIELAPLAALEDDDQIGGSLKTLLRHESPIVREVVEGMMSIMEANEEVNADFLQEMALLAIHVLAQPGFAENAADRNALIHIFASFIDPNTQYIIDGLEFAVQPTDKGRHITIDELEARATIRAAATTTDFEYIAPKEGVPGSVKTLDTLQPAYVVYDDDGVEHVFPIKWLKHFYVAQYSREDASCDSYTARFREEYPDLFNPKKQPKKFKFRLDKYFNTDE
jgi:hypothetical protein